MNPAETGEARLHVDDAELKTTDNDLFEADESHVEPLADLPAPSPVIQQLRAAYADADAERRKTFLIVPGRYRSALAFRAMPIPDEKFRKEAERAQRRGIPDGEAEATFAAKVIAHSCETIMVRDPETGELLPADEAVDEFKGTGLVRFDERLCQMLGVSPVPSSEYAIVRLVFRNKQAMRVLLRELLAFFTEETAGDEDDDEDEERPI